MYQTKMYFFKKFMSLKKNGGSDKIEAHLPSL